MKKRILSGLLCLVMVFSLVTFLPQQDVRAITMEEIEALRQEAKDLENQKNQLTQQINALKNDKAAAMKRKNLLETQINVLQGQISNTQTLIDHYEVLITQTRAELEDTEAQEALQYKRFCQRVRAMEENGSISYWSVLFHATDFADLLSRLADISEIMAYDQRVIDDLKSTQQQISDKKAQLEGELSQQEQAKADLVSRKTELTNQEAEVDKLISEIAKDQKAVEKAEAELRAAAEAMDAEVKAAEKAYAAQLAASGVVSEKGYYWPLPAENNVITSLFGGRIHPITGKAHNHTGLDLRATKGTEIYAAKSGIIITSTYNSSYGNYVTIKHTDNTTTLYAHMTSRSVKEGDIVAQGQVVGLVGSTGNSTGPHLHFEVRVDGVRQDPVDCFPDKELRIISGGKIYPFPH